MSKRLVLLLSGGIESIVIAAIAAQTEGRRHAVFVDYGQIPRQKELKAVRAITREYGIQLEVVTMEVPFLEDHDMLDEGGVIYSNELSEKLGMKPRPQAKADRGHVVPYRNLVFSTIAASYAETIGATELWMGFDYRPDLPSRTADKSPAFVAALEDVLAEGSDSEDLIQVVTPLQGYTKVDTIRRGHLLGVKWNTSWSCYNAFSLPCGVCAQCLTRKSAFFEAKIDEDVEYCSLEFIQAQLS